MNTANPATMVPQNMAGAVQGEFAPIQADISSVQPMNQAANPA